MTKKMDLMLKEISKKIIPTRETNNFISEELNLFNKKIKKRIKKLKLNVDVFVGGSFAKKTLVKKGSYDVDIFLRFDKKYEGQDLSKLTKKILRWTWGVSKVHGSRDYYKIKIAPWFFMEIVPVIKVDNPSESENITDLSASHVKFINKKIKSKKILDDVKIAKAFCYGAKVYGAESYVNGFSGYSIELLVYHYKSFEKFLRELSRKRKNKLIVDTEKLYKKPKDVLIELNGSKLLSPIILIDPTYKERNALAALNEESFNKFKIAARKFLKNPTEQNFFEKKVDLDIIKQRAEDNSEEFILIKTKTKKQEGDIAGTKLLKFHRHLVNESKKYFEVIDSGFKYLEKQDGKSYFVLKAKKELIFSGPLMSDKKNANSFIAQHSEVQVKKGRLHRKLKVTFTANDFFKKWKLDNERKIKEMYISKMKIE